MTYTVVILIISAFIVMIWEGSYFKEVVYTLLLAAILVAMGMIAQKFNIGAQSRQS
jgi:GABA permease